jgi:hypothetical protein
MSLRLRLRCFKGPSEEQFREVFAEQVERHGGAVHWLRSKTKPDEDLRTTHAGRVHTVYLPYLSGADYLICRLVGASLDVPWIETRIQEGSLWDYSLYSGPKHVDQFSTLPEYWEENDEQAAEKDLGDPGLLARLWDVPKERIERYLRHWGLEPLDDERYETKLRGKAYDSDKNEYGSIHQMFDFLSALGAVDPMAHGLLHRIIVPPIDDLQKAVKLL